MKRVYIIDDSKQIRERLIDLLADYPTVQVVGQSASAQEAVAPLDTLRPDILVLDVCLPGKSGIEFLHDAKIRWPDMLVFIMTNYDYPEYRRQSERAGADRFFNKTKDFEALIAALKKNDTEGYKPKSGE